MLKLLGVDRGWSELAVNSIFSRMVCITPFTKEQGDAHRIAMVGGSRKFLYFLFFFRGQLCMQCGNMYINGSDLPDQENELLIRK